jgi:hypothetical protein
LSTRFSDADIADLIETIVYLDEARGFGLAGLLARVAYCEPDVERIDYAHRLLMLRQRVLGDAYPFVITSTSVGRRERSRAPSSYIDLLAMSSGTPMRRAMSQADISECAACFERMCAIALEHLLGPGGKSVRFAWPSDCGRPPEFPAAVAWLAVQMGLRLGNGFRPPRRKDGGVDVIAWKSFGDGRTAFPVYLCQCTVQRDLLSKCSDIDIENWSRWLELLRDPVTVLMTPSIINGGGETWTELSQRNVILDRVRITKLVGATAWLPLQYRKTTVDRWLEAGCEWLKNC